MTAEVGSTELVVGHPSVRTLLRTRGELSATLFDERSRTAQELNDSAAAVWALLDRPVTVDELVADLVEVIGLEPGQAAEIVAAAVETFAEADLLLDPNAPDEDAETEVDDAAGAPEPVDEAELPERLTRAPDP